MHPNPTIPSVLIGFMFFTAGLDKAMNMQKVATGLQNRVSAGFPNITVPSNLFLLAIAFATILELVAPVLITYSAYTGQYGEYAHRAAQSLVIFTILATITYYYPFTGSGWYPFVSNLATIGGLMMLCRYFRQQTNRIFDNYVH